MLLIWKFSFECLIGFLEITFAWMKLKGKLAFKITTHNKCNQDEYCSMIKLKINTFKLLQLVSNLTIFFISGKSSMFYWFYSIFTLSNFGYKSVLILDFVEWKKKILFEREKSFYISSLKQRTTLISLLNSSLDTAFCWTLFFLYRLLSNLFFIFEWWSLQNYYHVFLESEIHIPKLWA